MKHKTEIETEALAGEVWQKMALKSKQTKTNRGDKKINKPREIAIMI